MDWRVRLTVNRMETIVFSDSYWIPINGNLIVSCCAHPIYWVHWGCGITSHVAISGIGNQSSSHDGNRPNNYHRHQRFLYCYTPRFISILTCGTYHWKIGTQLQVTLFPFMTTWLQNFQKPISSISNFDINMQYAIFNIEFNIAHTNILTQWCLDQAVQLVYK